MNLQYYISPKKYISLVKIFRKYVNGFERLINRHLRRWLGVPPSFTSIELYGRTNQLKLPMTSIVEEFNVAKGRLVVTLKQSTDDLIRRAGIETYTGRKWKVISKPSSLPGRNSTWQYDSLATPGYIRSNTYQPVVSNVSIRIKDDVRQTELV